jgi:hypothetical protein
MRVMCVAVYGIVGAVAAMVTRREESGRVGFRGGKSESGFS